MKTEGEIRQKIKQAQFRHIKRILRDSMPEGEVWSRHEVENVKNHYKAFFSSAPVHVIAKDFPDVAALMWVLGDHPDCCLMVGGSLVGSLGGVFLWADSDPEGEAARSTIENLVSSLASSRQTPPSEEVGQDLASSETPDPPQVQETLDPAPCVSDETPNESPPDQPPEFNTSVELQVSDDKFGWLTKVWKRVFN